MMPTWAIARWMTGKSELQRPNRISKQKWNRIVLRETFITFFQRSIDNQPAGSAVGLFTLGQNGKRGQHGQRARLTWKSKLLLIRDRAMDECECGWERWIIYLVSVDLIVWRRFHCFSPLLENWEYWSVHYYIILFYFDRVHNIIERYSSNDIVMRM